MAGLRPEGGVDLAAALGRAYDLLSRSSADPAGSSARCTRVLFLVTGTEDDCYARECGPASPGPCTCTSSILAAVRAKQASLAADNAEPVNLIVLSFGGVTDELGRQLTCGGAGAAAQGLWVPISDDGGNLITAMAPAYRWLSTARRGVDLLPESVFFSGTLVSREIRTGDVMEQGELPRVGACREGRFVLTQGPTALLNGVLLPALVDLLPRPVRSLLRAAFPHPPPLLPPPAPPFSLPPQKSTRTTRAMAK